MKLGAGVDYQLNGSYGKYSTLYAPIFSGSYEKPSSGKLTIHVKDQEVSVIRLPYPEGISFNTNEFKYFSTSRKVFTDLERLSILLKQVAGVTRIEPFNKYMLHRNIPSARALFLAKLGIGLRNKDSEQFDLYDYDIDYHVLIKMGSKICRDIDKSCTAFAFIAADIGKVAEMYGDFSAYLGMLEAGHMLAAVELNAAALNIDVQHLDEASIVNLFELVEYSKKQQLITNVISLNINSLNVKDEKINAYLQENFNVQALNNTINKTEFSLLDRLCESLNRGHQAPSFKKIKNTVMPTVPNGFDLMRSNIQRSSGTYPQILSGRQPMSKTHWDRLREVWSFLLSTVSPIKIHCDHLSIYAGCLNVEDLDAALYKIDFDNKLQIFGGGESMKSLAQKALDPLGKMFDATSIPLFFCIAVNYHQINKIYGDFGFKIIQESAGKIAQLLSIALTDINYFARPIKTGSELLLETLIDPHENIVYVVISGEKKYSELSLVMEN